MCAVTAEPGGPGRLPAPLRSAPYAAPAGAVHRRALPGPPQLRLGLAWPRGGQGLAWPASPRNAPAPEGGVGGAVTPAHRPPYRPPALPGGAGRKTSSLRGVPHWSSGQGTGTLRVPGHGRGFPESPHSFPATGTLLIAPSPIAQLTSLPSSLPCSSVPLFSPQAVPAGTFCLTPSTTPQPPQTPQANPVPWLTRTLVQGLKLTMTRQSALFASGFLHLSKPCESLINI